MITLFSRVLQYPTRIFEVLRAHSISLKFPLVFGFRFVKWKEQGQGKPGTGLSAQFPVTLVLMILGKLSIS